MNSVVPILKWAGGKRWLVGKSGNLFPSNYDRLIEPFAGGAAVFFALKPEAAWLNDMNADLIDMYSAIAEDWQAVLDHLKRHQAKHGHEHYYRSRAAKPRSLVARAARFIYLNRTCFNGLYRVNLQGIFNVPIGTKSSVLLSTDDFEQASIMLRKVKLTTFDFERVVDKAGKGDFIFADPPYTVKHNLNGFIKYNEKLFSWSDQIRLRDALFRASSRGAYVVLSNANHQSVRDLYRDCGEMRVASRRSIMAASALDRKSTTELLIRV